MSLILNIDTVDRIAKVSIAENGETIDFLTNDNQKDHAGFLQTGIKTILQKLGISLKDLAAVSVVAGPGSYTGIRVGLASAKGLSYTLKIPLIGINSLELLAFSVNFETNNDETLIAPMIDARRSEVFTAVYDSSMKIILPSCNMILEKSSFGTILDKFNVIFIGSGKIKWQAICDHKNSLFFLPEVKKNGLELLSHKNFIEKKFIDIAYSEPFYLKEFVSTSKTKNK